MNGFKLLADPFWVNFLILVPFALFAYWRKNKLKLSRTTLLHTAIFGIAFGFIEAACVIYLRASLNMLPGFHGSLAQVQQQSTQYYSQITAAGSIPQSLLVIELLREFSTIILLFSAALLGAKKITERFALFLFAFAFWDIFYYLFLFLTIRWPQNFTTMDVLFLIPTPWTSQVWFPILISSLTIIAVVVSSKKPMNK